MNKIKKFLLLFLIITLCIITPVMGETINYEYSSVNTYTFQSSPSTSPSALYDRAITLKFGEIEKYYGLQSLIYGISSAYYNVRNPNIITDEINTNFYISGVKVGSGMVQFTANELDGGSSTGTLLITFDDLDLSGYTGAKDMTMDYTYTNFNFVFENGANAISTTNINNVPYPFCASTSYYSRLSFTSAAYCNINFIQTLSYDYNDITDTTDFNFYRNNYANRISIKNNDEILIYDRIDSLDVSYNGIYGAPLTIEVTNPYTNDIWENIFPETSTTTPTGTTTMQYHIVDGAQEYKDLTCNYVITQYVDGEYIAYDSGTAYGGYLFQNYDNGYKYKIQFSKDGYTDSLGNTYFEIAYVVNIEELTYTDATIRLYEDVGENITLVFKAYDSQTLTKLSGVTVTLNGETQTTDDAGYTAFENITKTAYTYTASLSGYETFSGSGTYDYSANIDLPLHKTSTATLQNIFIDATFPEKFITTNYLIEKKTNGIFDTYKTGKATGGFMAINLEKGFDYRGTYTATGYTDVIVNYTPFYESISVKIRMFPTVEGGLYTVGFIVVDTDDNVIPNAKVTANGVIKYTGYIGETAFGIDAGTVSYEVSKDGYHIATGNETVESNMIIQVTLVSETEGTITPTPTPTTNENPSNIFESIKYGLGKIFGWNTNSESDIKNTNLIIALMITMSSAGGIAYYTRDGLGALVGGVFGFLISTALGLIPLWVLFTGFAAIAIYIVIFKSGGND